MIKRYQIQDIISQDETGIVFQAMDSESSAVVIVRRFFPFGVGGGGLHGDEQDAYGLAIRRLAEIQHTHLRAVISGGCDPVDGMPFITTEWIEGETLSQHCQGRRLSAADTVHVLLGALDVSQLISQVLEEDGVWVDTELDGIVVGREDGGRGVTFGLSPIKWLGRGGEGRDFRALISLTEELMGWHSETVPDQAGTGLGGWLVWLRGVAATASIDEVREMLVAASAHTPAAPSQQLVPKVVRPMPVRHVAPARKKSINGLMVTIIALCLLAVGLVGWVLFRDASATSWVRSGWAEMVAKFSGEAPPAAGAAATPEVETFAPDDSRILKKANQQVVLRGVLRKIENVGEENVIHLLFSDAPVWDSPRGRVISGALGSGLTEVELQSLIGKMILLRGTLSVPREAEMQGTEITFTERTAIELAE